MKDLDPYIFKEGLGKGLRTSAFNSRNSQALITCEGVFPENKVLRAMDSINQTNVTSLNATFPYPQIFTCSEQILAFTPTKGYVLVGTTWTEKLSVSTEGVRWGIADFGDVVFAANGTMTMEINLAENSWVENVVIPASGSMCSTGNQLIVGSPNVDAEQYWLFSASSVLIHWLHHILHVDLSTDSLW